MHEKSLLLAVTLLTEFASQPARATVYGVFSNASNAVDSAAVTIIRAAGDTASVLPDLTAASLSGIKVLFLLNGSTSTALTNLTTNAAATNSFVQGGGVFTLNDSEVSAAAGSVPGAAKITFMGSAASNIIPGASSTLVSGPAGIIGATTLDTSRTSNSAYGHAAVNILPAGATTLLTRVTAVHAVAFSYKLGAGSVYYSTIPLG